ncbi:TetR/AcrR family transcriptional regulator [Streptomyces sp. NPDC054765]
MKHRYHHGALKGPLIQATRQLLAEKGTDGFTFKELARRVGVSRAAPYRHFPSRDALFAAVVTSDWELLSKLLTESAQRGMGPIARLKLFGVSCARFAAQHTDLFSVMSGERYVSGVEAAHRTCFESVVDSVAEAQETGLLTTRAPSAEVARLLWATAHGMTVLHVNGGLEACGPDGGSECLTESVFVALLG